LRGRASLSTLLLLGGFVLLIAVGIGMNMGNRVLGQIGAHVPVQPTAVPAATDDPAGHGEVAGWKRVTVMSVATDPGFPDPRITPEPEIPATPKPRPKNTEAPQGDDQSGSDRQRRRADEQQYTSPPLPIPLVTHTPVEQDTPGPDIEATPQGQANVRPGRQTAVRPSPGKSGVPGRDYPTIPPVPVPSYNP
jgi:hypothetical protein